jgi:hypothetical protein
LIHIFKIFTILKRIAQVVAANRRQGSHANFVVHNHHQRSSLFDLQRAKPVSLHDILPVGVTIHHLWTSQLKEQHNEINSDENEAIEETHLDYFVQGSIVTESFQLAINLPWATSNSDHE